MKSIRIAAVVAIVLSTSAVAAPRTSKGKPQPPPPPPPTVFPVVLQPPFQPGITSSDDACQYAIGTPTCSEDATADAATGEIALAAMATSPGLAADAGFASAIGSIRQTVAISGATAGQGFTVTVEAQVADASATSFPAIQDLDEFASVSLWLYVQMGCSGCGMPGSRWVLVETGDIKKPSSVSGPYTFTMTVRPPAAQTITSLAIEPRFFASAQLGDRSTRDVPISPLDRRAQASLSVDVERIVIERAP